MTAFVSDNQSLTLNKQKVQGGQIPMGASKKAPMELTKPNIPTLRHAKTQSHTHAHKHTNAPIYTYIYIYTR